MSIEEPWQALKYTYNVDFTKPYFLAKHFSIFDVDRKVVAQAPENACDAEITYSDSKNTVAKSIAASCSIEGSYMAFSGKASMGLSATSNSQTHTIRIDARVRARSYACSAKGRFRMSPHKFLEDGVADYINDESPEDIVDMLGCFYAYKCALGGVFEKSYIMEATEDDDEQSVHAELEASYGGLFSVSGSAQMKATSRKSNKNCRMTIKWHCEGGNTKLWLGCNRSNFEATQKAWAATVDDSNLFVYGLKLQPIWKLIKKVNPQKGKAVQALLEKRWAKQKWNPIKWAKKVNAIPTNCTVYLQGHTGNFLQNQAPRAHFTNTNRLGYEAMKIIHVGGGEYVIESQRTKCNLQAKPNGDCAFENKNRLLWERWTIEKVGKKYCFVSKHTGKVLQCRPNGSCATVNTNRLGYEQLNIFTR